MPYAGVAQLVRASACHAEGRGFKSRHSRHSQVWDGLRKSKKTLFLLSIYGFSVYCLPKKFVEIHVQVGVAFGVAYKYS